METCYKIKTINSKKDLYYPGVSDTIYMLYNKDKQVYEQYVWIVDDTKPYHGYYEIIK